jgi:hypothetical protein
MTHLIDVIAKAIGDEPLGTLTCKTCGAEFPDSEHFDYPHEECAGCALGSLMKLVNEGGFFVNGERVR